jgi:hypothetical protein
MGGLGWPQVAVLQHARQTHTSEAVFASPAVTYC